MERLSSPEVTNAQVIDLEEARQRREAAEVADSKPGLPTEAQAGANVVDIADRLDSRTQRVMGTRTGEIQDDLAHEKNFTDPDSGETRDLDRTVRSIEAEANKELAQLGIQAKVGEAAIRSATVAAGVDEDRRGLHNKATGKRPDDVVTDTTQETVEQQVVLETVKEELDRGAEMLSLSKRVRDELGARGVANVIALRPEVTSALHEELTAASSDELVGYSADGEEQRFEHSTESGPFLMNVLNGRMAEATKDLNDDGKEQLYARVEDFQEKYGVKNLADAKLEVHDLQRLERIFFKENTNEQLQQAYRDAQYEAA